MTTEADVVEGELVLTARITTASNATFTGTIGEVPVVYKPVAGERPLWDFPDGRLADRERASYLVSEALAWNIVPPTWLRDGPMGAGMVQVWQTVDPTQDAVDVVAVDSMPATGWRHVFDALDGSGRPVSLIHEDSAALRRMAVFDVIVNNADRKGGHVLAMLDRHRHGVDHGLTFHIEPKLRTVLWGWLGEELRGDEVEGVRRVVDVLAGPLGDALGPLLHDDEIEAFGARCRRLLEDHRFPAPEGEMPAIPWPPF